MFLIKNVFRFCSTLKTNFQTKMSFITHVFTNEILFTFANPSKVYNTSFILSRSYHHVVFVLLLIFNFVCPTTQNKSERVNIGLNTSTRSPCLVTIIGTERYETEYETTEQPCPVFSCRKK